MTQSDLSLKEQRFHAGRCQVAINSLSPRSDSIGQRILYFLGNERNTIAQCDGRNISCDAPRGTTYLGTVQEFLADKKGRSAAFVPLEQKLERIVRGAGFKKGVEGVSCDLYKPPTAYW